MIPKIVHYCWFGNKKKPLKVKKNIDNWKKNNPDFKLVEWNEKNFDISKSCDFVKDAYSSQKWAFVSDYVRLYAIYNFGGVYLDTDVKLLKPLESVIDEFSGGYMGFEDANKIASGLGFGAPKNNPIIKRMMDYYLDMEFDKDKPEKQSCPIINSKIINDIGGRLNNKKQYIDEFCLLPTEYLCPFDIYSGQYNVTENTISIHMYDASWMRNDKKLWMYMIFHIKKILPNFLVRLLRKSR